MHESLQNVVGSHVSTEMFQGEQYPPEFDITWHMEPVGDLYPMYKEWERVDQKLKVFY